MNKNYLISNLIAKILEFAFIIISIINLYAVSHHLCCDMESAVISIMVLFGLLEMCILTQIIDDIICLIKIKKEHNMERLTHKNYIEEYAVNFEKSSDKSWSIAESDTHIKVTGEPIKKLGELEDVLEKYDIETTEELDGVLKPLIDNGELENWKSAKFWKMQTERLKQELAEFKQKAIVPKFQTGQDVFIILDAAIKETNINSITIFAGNELSYYCKYVNNEKMYLELDEEEIFATKEEAEQKLTEIGGKDE